MVDQMMSLLGLDGLVAEVAEWRLEIGDWRKVEEVGIGKIGFVKIVDWFGFVRIEDLLRGLGFNWVGFGKVL